MGDISALLANAADTKADFDLGKLNKSYWEGLDQAAKNNLRDALSKIPPGADGQPNYPAITTALLQGGDIANGAAFAGLGARQQDRTDYANSLSPSANRGAMVPDAPPRNQQGGVSQPQGSPQGAPQQGRGPIATGPNSIVGIVGNAGVPDELAGPEINTLGGMLSQALGRRVDANEPLDMGDPKVRTVLAGYQRAKAQGQQGGQPIPQQVAQAPQQVAPQQPVSTPPMEQMSPEDQQAAKREAYFSTREDKAVAETARIKLKAILDKYSPTNDQKNARASNETVPQYQQRAVDQEIEKAGGVERAKADVAEQGEYYKEGKAASNKLQVLNTMRAIIDNDKNIGLGFGADTELRLKKAVQRLGITELFGKKIDDLSGPELLQKLGTQLASESTKSISSRPAVFEFSTFLKNNPGLLLTREGNLRLIDLLSQQAKRQVDLGRLARDNQDKWAKWDNVVEQYDKKNPTVDPVTKAVLSTDSIIAPGPNKSQRASTSPVSGTAQASPTISSKADYDKLLPGAQFTGPDGKSWQKP